MKPYWQVLHVAAKDLRVSRWTLGVYVVILTISAAVAAGWPSIAPSGIDAISNLVIPVGMGIAALLVQADSPVRTDAFWVTRPLSSAAVAGAKVVAVIAGLVLPGLIAQWIALRSFDLPAAEIPKLLLGSAAFYGAFLLAAMTVAVFTPDLKSALVTMVVAIVGWMFLSSMLPTARMPTVVSPYVEMTIRGLPILLIVIAVAHQYARRNGRRSRGIILVAAVAGLAMPRFTTSREMPPRARAVPTRDLVRLIDARLDMRSRPNRIVFRFAMLDSVSKDRLVMQWARLYVVDTAGREIPLALESQRPNQAVNGPALRVGGKVRWLAKQTFTGDTAWIQFNLDDQEAVGLARGDAVVHVAMRMTVERAESLAVLPMLPGSRARGPRAHFQLDSINVSPAPTLTLRVATVQMESLMLSWGTDRFGFALVNPARAEAVRMSLKGSSGGGSAMPLPGVSSSTERTSLALDRDPRDPPTGIDQEWMRGAELRIFEWRKIREAEIDLAAKPSLMPSTESIPSPARPPAGSMVEFKRGR